MEAIKKREKAERQYELIKNTYQNGSLGFISASKGEDTPIDNYNTGKLAEDIQKEGGIPLKGTGLTEEFGNERSFAVVGLSKEKLLELGKKYNQAEVIYGNQRINTTPENYGKVIGPFDPAKTELVRKSLQHIKNKQKKGKLENQTYMKKARTRILLRV